MDPRALAGVRKIAVIWVGRLGDFLITIPFLNGLRRRFPGATITVVVGERGREAAELSNAVDETLALGGLGTVRAAARLAAGGYDLLIDLNSSFSKTSVALSRFARARVKLAFHRSKGNGPFTHTEACSDDLHMLDRYALLAKALGAPYAPEADAELRLDPAELSAGREAVLRASGGEAAALIHPGNFKKFDNRWPEDHFVALTQRLISRGGPRPVYLAGPGEEAPVRAIAERSSPRAAVVGPMSLAATAGALRACELLIVNATGTAHLGWLLKVPTFTFLSGYTAKIWMHGPSALHHDVRSSSWESCRDIPVDSAWAALEPFLASLPRRAKTSA
ncbi:MAG: glycosyltransferase family 9 protein [Elusimicrobia bacterium]|nr:glycosyltransferase family 9 protein [Elusimicrobiota bacterium]